MKVRSITDRDSHEMLVMVFPIDSEIGFSIRRRIIMSLKSTTEKTCCWCIGITIAALTLLALTWMLILASETSVSGMIKIVFPD